ncbi:hypothetical protein C8F01DRAFT_1372021 [Mycena amicta]|nr:hypothetical protein C8F01DRAFT_1372021 [Mycena amicta]
MPTPLHLLFVLVLSLLPLLTLVAAQANRTVDDFSPLLSYTPESAIIRGDLTGFDISKLYNGTVTIMNATVADSVNMSFKFTGSEIYIFLAKPQNDGQFGNGYQIYMDGVAVSDVGSFDQETDAEYADLAYSNTSMRLAPHTLVFEATAGEVYLDYVVFRSNNPTPETSIPPLPEPSSASASGVATSGRSKATTGTSNPNPPNSSESATGTVKKLASHTALIAGAAAGVVILLLLGTGVAVCVFVRRRGRSRTQTQSPYGGGMGPGYPPPTMSQAGSDAALLYNSSAGASQHSLHGHGHHLQPQMPPPPPMPRPPQQEYEYARYPGPGAVQQQQQYQPMHNPYSPPPHAQSYDTSPNAYLQPHQLHQQQQHNAYPPSPSPSPSSPSPSSPSAYSSSAHSHSHSLVYDPNASRTLAYAQSLEGTILAEQRAVEAEYARPGSELGWGDEKKRAMAIPVQQQQQQQRGNVNEVKPEQRFGVMNPDSRSVGRSWSTRTGTSTAPPLANPAPVSYPYPSRTPSAPSPRSHSRSPAASNPPASPDISNIAAEMHALRAQVARLEGERLEREGVPPPAYD